MYAIRSYYVLSVVLMGQPELRRRLRHRAYEPLRQRIGMQYDLQPLNRDETADYLDFRMVTAGGEPGLFMPAAIDQIFAYSGGVPRKINHAASLALLEGFGRESRVIDPNIVAAVMHVITSYSIHYTKLYDSRMDAKEGHKCRHLEPAQG